MEKQQSRMSLAVEHTEANISVSSTCSATPSNISNDSAGFETSKKGKKIKIPKVKDRKLKKKTSKKWKPDKLSKNDFFSKTSEYRMWLQEFKCLNLDELTSNKAKELFKKFVKKWNNKKLPQKYYVGADPMWTVASPSTYSRLSVGSPYEVDANGATPKGFSPLYTEAKFSTFGKRRGKLAFTQLQLSSPLTSAQAIETPQRLEEPIRPRAQSEVFSSTSLSRWKKSGTSLTSAVSYDDFTPATIGRRNLRTRASMRSLLSVSEVLPIPVATPSLTSTDTPLKRSYSNDDLPPPPDFLLPPPKGFRANSGSSLSSCSSQEDPDCQLMPPPPMVTRRQTSGDSIASFSSCDGALYNSLPYTLRTRRDSQTSSISCGSAQSVTSTASSQYTPSGGRKSAPPPPPRRTPVRTSSSSISSVNSDTSIGSQNMPPPSTIPKISRSSVKRSSRSSVTSTDSVLSGSAIRASSSCETPRGSIRRMSNSSLKSVASVDSSSSDQVMTPSVRLRSNSGSSVVSSSSQSSTASNAGLPPSGAKSSKRMAPPPPPRSKPLSVLFPEHSPLPVNKMRPQSLALPPTEQYAFTPLSKPSYSVQNIPATLTGSTYNVQDENSLIQTRSKSSYFDTNTPFRNQGYPSKEKSLPPEVSWQNEALKNNTSIKKQANKMQMAANGGDCREQDQGTTPLSPHSPAPLPATPKMGTLSMRARRRTPVKSTPPVPKPSGPPRPPPPPGSKGVVDTSLYMLHNKRRAGEEFQTPNMKKQKSEEALTPVYV